MSSEDSSASSHVTRWFQVNAGDGTTRFCENVDVKRMRGPLASQFNKSMTLVQCRAFKLADRTQAKYFVELTATAAHAAAINVQLRDVFLGTIATTEVTAAPPNESSLALLISVGAAV